MKLLILITTFFLSIANASYSSEDDSSKLTREVSSHDGTYFVHVSDIMPTSCTKIPGNGRLYGKEGEQYEKMMPGRITLHHCVCSVVPSEQMFERSGFMGVPSSNPGSDTSNRKYACIDVAEAFSSGLYGGSAADMATVGIHNYGRSACFIIPRSEEAVFRSKNVEFSGQVIFYDTESNVRIEVEKYLRSAGGYLFSPNPKTFNSCLFPVPYDEWDVTRNSQSGQDARESFVRSLSTLLLDRYQGAMCNGPLESFEHVAHVLNNCHKDDYSSVLHPTFRTFAKNVWTWNDQRFMLLQLPESVQRPYKLWQEEFVLQFSLHNSEDYVQDWPLFPFGQFSLTEEQFLDIMSKAESCMTQSERDITVLKFLKERFVYKHSDPLTFVENAQPFIDVIGNIWESYDSETKEALKEFQCSAFRHLGIAIKSHGYALEGRLVEILNSQEPIGQLWQQCLAPHGKVVEIIDSPWSSELLVHVYDIFLRNFCERLSDPEIKERIRQASEAKTMRDAFRTCSLL